MKSYHITQEEAWKVAEDLDYINSPESGLSGTVLMSKLELQAYANAVLDKVLGEQWIKVEDRLPEHTLYSGTPLDDGWGKPIPPFYKSERVLSLDEYGTVYIGKLDIIEGKVIPKITHWMPLTKLYAPKEQS